MTLIVTEVTKTPRFHLLPRAGNERCQVSHKSMLGR